MSQSEVFARPSLNLSLVPPRDHRSDFNLIDVIEHLVFGDEIITFDHEMRFHNEIQLAQEILDLFGAFDFDGSSWMAQLDLHGRIISCRYMREQGDEVKRLKYQLKREKEKNRFTRIIHDGSWRNRAVTT